jgi:hypothetical protein
MGVPAVAVTSAALPVPDGFVGGGHQMKIAGIAAAVAAIPAQNTKLNRRLFTLCGGSWLS